MNYKRIYNNIIGNRKDTPLGENEYGEFHHIVPKSLGGRDDSDNLVRLSAREHFMCHALLAEMYNEGTNEWYKMNHAFLMMKCSSENHNNNRYFNSRLYEYKKKDFSKVMSKSQSGKNNSQYGKVWMYHLDTEENIMVNKSEVHSYEKNGYTLGRKNVHSDEVKAQISETFRKYGLTKIELRNLHLKVEKEKKEEKNRKYYNQLFETFKKSDCNSIREFVRSGYYDKSHVALTYNFKKYVKEYNPKPNRPYNTDL